MHDFIEVYTGDVNSLVASPEAMSRKALTEKVVFDRLESELGEMWPEFVTLVHEYEELKDPEARFVKCFDKCDASVSHYYSRGKAPLKMGITTPEEYAVLSKRVQERMEKYADEFPDVIALRQELLLRVANQAYATV